MTRKPALEQTILDDLWGGVRAMSFFGHGGSDPVTGKTVPTFAGLAAAKWKNSALMEAQLRLGKRRGLSPAEFERRARERSRNLGLDLARNYSCHSFSDQSIARLFVKPGGRYFGAEKSLLAGPTLDYAPSCVRGLACLCLFSSYDLTEYRLPKDEGSPPPAPKPEAAAKFRAYLFRVWPPDKPKDVGYVLYARIEETGKPGLFKFPDGSGGWYWRVGEASGPYRDAEGLCPVLRGYGRTSVSYNLGWAPHITCPKEGPARPPKLELPKGLPTLEEGVNRGGGDYRDFDLSAADPKLCRRECGKDSRCWAYTYVKPGLQGGRARCWLKSSVPSPKPDACCVSGARP